MLPSWRSATSSTCEVAKFAYMLKDLSINAVKILHFFFFFFFQRLYNLTQGTMFRLLARQPRLEAIGRHRASPLVTVTRSLRARSSLSIAPFFEETQENTSKWMWSAIVGGMAATAGVGLSLNQESGPETSWGSYQYTTDPVKVQKSTFMKENE